jgi:nucleoside phosphorylase
MYAIAASVATNITLAKSSGGDVVLDYQPVVVPGGNGVSGPTFVDNAAYREYVFNTFEAKALDMESAALAHVATQFGVKFLVFRSLSDLAGGDAAGNVLSVFFSVAAANAVATMSAFMEALPIENSSDAYPTPMDHTPGEDTTGLLGVLSFWQPELEALKAIMNEGKPEELVFGGRIFYRGMIHGADVVATLTGVSISNTAMTTALMAMLYPGIERITGGGIAGGVDPLLKVGDVVVPERWALYQMQIYGREISDGVYEPPSFDRDLIVGKSCGAFDGVDTFLMGDGPCDYLAGEASTFGMIFPTSIQTPNPNDPLGENQISEGPTRKVRFLTDSIMIVCAFSLSLTQATFYYLTQKVVVRRGSRDVGGCQECHSRAGSQKRF